MVFVRKLTRKFKEGFKSYDYISQDIDVLLSLLDTILEMMTIVEMSDHDNILKLTSFTRLLSSRYSNTILDAAIIEDIYVTTILPVLDHFNDKYTTKFVAISSKEIVNGIPRTEFYTDERVLDMSNEFCNGNIDFKAYRKFLREEAESRYSEEQSAEFLNGIRSLDKNSVNEDIIHLNNFIRDNKDTDDPIILRTIFNMSKDMVSILYNVYDTFTNGKSKEHKEKYINDLILLRDTMETVSYIDDIQIQLMSDVIRSLCFSLIDELSNNDILPPTSIVSIESQFKSIEGIKYKSNSFDSCGINTSK